MKRLVSLIIVGVLAGCTTWRAEALEPARFHADTAQTVRLVLRTGDTVSVRSAVIRGDTVIGVGRSGAVRIPVAEVEHAEVQDVSTPRSLALIGGLGVVVVGLAYWAAHAVW